jgi:ribonucleoside-diphosphate reductase alpha subunit
MNAQNEGTHSNYKLVKNDMYVRKRDGNFQVVSFDKILARIKSLGETSVNCKENLTINYTELAIKVIEQLYDGIETTKIDELTAEQCASMSVIHPDYATLASRIMISNHHKNTSPIFSDVIQQLYEFKDIHGTHSPLVSETLHSIVMKNKDILDKMVLHERDYLFDYFGFKTLERAYLMRINKVIVERPQYMWLRVSIGIHGNRLDKVKETYDLMSQKYFTHATPTLFNSGTPRPQLSSCYLLAMESDSIQGIYNTLGECAAISKWAGGIGLHIHNIRASGSHIRGTNGSSNGIVPMLRVFNNTARYVDQGGGKRNGSFAIYLEPWHGDIEDFLEMKKNHGDEEIKARDLFYALWVPDLFMKRIKNNDKWTLMCPDQCPGLSDVYGEEFDNLYIHYENEGRGIKTIPARDLWIKILDSQIETGTPYLLYKDACNMKSNQKNLGTIKSSNLCTEIVEYSDHEETAVCNLASIALPMFVRQPDVTGVYDVKIYSKTDCVYCKLSKLLLKKHNIRFTEYNLDDDNTRADFYSYESERLGKEIHSVPQIYMNGEYVGGYTELQRVLRPTYNFEELHHVTKIVTKNLDKVIDVNFYPTEKTRHSNYQHRPIGIGVQGLADTFSMMDMAFTSEDAQRLNRAIFETIYHASIEASCELAKERRELMYEIKQKYQQGLFSFKSTKKSCREYIFSDDEASRPSCLFMQMLETVKPIFGEMNLNDNHCGSYSSFDGSPASQGILQFDMWGDRGTGDAATAATSTVATVATRATVPTYNWTKVKEEVMQYGMRNSLLIAPMPTASTSQILGFNECIEPFTSNIYLRRTIAGEFIVLNKYLMRDLILLDLWNVEMKNKIIYHKGSIQNISEIPKQLREKYKIVWEMPMKNIIDMASERGKFICQSQSLNLWMDNPTYDKMTAMHFYSWQKGLKTGIYYLRTKAKASAQQFTIDPSMMNKKIKQTTENSGMNGINDGINDDDNDEICEMCSS